MSLAPLIVGTVLILAFVTLVVASRQAAVPGNRVWQALTTLTAIPMVGFFVFGFLAAAEVPEQMTMFRVIYSLLIVVVGAGVAFAWKRPAQSNG